MKLTGAIVLGLVGLLLLALPNLTRKGLLFGCHVGVAFPQTDLAKRSLREFRLFNGLIFAAVVAAFLGLPASVASTAYTICPLVMVLSTLLLFLWEHRRISPFALQESVARLVSLSAGPDRWPWFFWVGLLPLVVVGGSAAWLQLHWSEIPLRFATHWNLNGEPDGWSTRSTVGVYGPLAAGLATCLLILGLGFITWSGARRSRFRRVTVGSLVATAVMISGLFSAEAMQPWLHLPVWVFALAPFLFVLVILMALVRAGSMPEESSAVMRESAWKGGVFYFNPDDPALFVEKRFGLGYTLNFGNHWSWFVVAGLVIFTFGIVMFASHR